MNKQSTRIRDYGKLAGKHCLTIKGEVVGGPYSTGNEAHQAKLSLFPDGRHPDTGHDVFVSYYPTLAEGRKWDRFHRAQEAFNVCYWYVAENRRVNGRRMLGVALSPKFASRQECRKAFAEIKGKKPWAYMGRVTMFFNWLTADDIVNRKALLNDIRHPVT